MTLAALDFWLTSGWHLCDRDSEGHLLAGTDFMTAYFQRPELALVEESCPAERALHAKLAYNYKKSVNFGNLMTLLIFFS